MQAWQQASLVPLNATSSDTTSDAFALKGALPLPPPMRRRLKNTTHQVQWVWWARGNAIYQLLCMETPKTRRLTIQPSFIFWNQIAMINDVLPRRAAVWVFVAFASAYLLSTLLRAITATLSPSLTVEFGLHAQDLGLLAGGYFLGFCCHPVADGSLVRSERP
jgi:hypothetical protein